MILFTLSFSLPFLYKTNHLLIYLIYRVSKIFLIYIIDLQLHSLNFYSSHYQIKIVKLFL